MLFRRALERAPGAPKGESNLIFRHFQADLVTFEVVEWPQNLESRTSIWDENHWHCFDTIFTKHLSQSVHVGPKESDCKV